MPSGQDSGEARQRLDELRRRLYRADATEEDLRRYAEQRASLVAEEPDAPLLPPPRSRHPVRLLIAATGGAALIAAIVGIAVIAPTSRVTQPKPSASSAAQVEDIGDGQTMTVTGIAAFGLPSSTVRIGDAGVVAQRFTGSGAAVVPLDTSDAPLESGRVLVALSPAQPAPIAWRALAVRTRISVRVVARSGIGGRADDPYPTLFAYKGDRPSRIAVDAEAGVRWTLLVAFTGPTADAR